MESKKEAYKRKLKEFANDDRFISGIHNYCDRWCERCTMTSKCRVYAMDPSSENENSDIKDSENKEYWNHLEVVFDAIHDLVDEITEREGISLDDIENTEEIHQSETSNLENNAKEYGNKMMDWLKQNREKVIELASKYQKENIKEIENSLEVIVWYCFFIEAKIHRADSQKVFSKNEIIDEAQQYDINGSAKIASIAIEKSINAISVLYQHISEFEDELLGFLVNLSKLKTQLHNKFPDAKNFKRPGFDD